MTDNQHAADALRHLPSPDGAANALAYATLAVAVEIRQNSDLLRTYLDSVNPPAAAPDWSKHADEQLQQEISDEQITGLAATLWAADPGNQASPAQRFQDDYAHRQDQYLAMARAALGLTDQPQRKDPRKP